MDKYEYKIKAEQIEKLYNKKDYETAKKIADTIDWRRVRNISMLFMISDIYEKNEKLEDSKEILQLAYERSPLGRMIVYKLVEICIALNEYEEAIEFYREYIQLAPHDPSRYLLKYKIHKGMNAPPNELISILEQFKEKEYHEEWAYQLASLYHQAGMRTECVEECDELILWFDRGKYVEKAMELKMLHQPLSLVQQEKYDHRNDVIEEIEEVKTVEEVEVDREEKNSPEEVFDPKTEINMDLADDQYDEEEAIDRDIGESNEKGKFSLSKFFSNKKLSSVEIPVKTSEDILPEDEVIHVEHASVDKFSTINLQAELAKSMEKILGTTTDQKEEIEIDNEVDKQITGQMNINEILAEFEKTKEVKAIHDTGDIMDILSDIVPKIEDPVQEEEPVISEEEPVSLEEVAPAKPEQIEETVAIGEEKDVSDFENIEMKIAAAIERLEFQSSEFKSQDIGPTVSEDNITEDKLFEEFKFSPFTSSQIKDVIHSLEKTDSLGDKGKTINIIVTGQPGTGKTTLAIGILKLIQKSNKQKFGKLAKVKGQALNKKDITKVIEKISGGALIIEDASKLSEKAINDLDGIMSSDENYITIILEDGKKALEQLLSKYECFATKFSFKINLPGYSNEELVNFGRQYANEKGYEVDEMGVLALYTRIDQIRDDDREIKLNEIKEILDEAIEVSKKKKVSKLINKILGKRYSETDLILLYEQDFQV